MFLQLHDYYCVLILQQCKSHTTLHSTVFKPIFASAKICINPNADVELKSPKAKVQLEVQNIAIEISKPQVSARVLCVNIIAPQTRYTNSWLPLFRVYTISCSTCLCWSCWSQ